MRRPMPFGDPARWPIGSPQSRAAARAMAEATEAQGSVILTHSVSRPLRPGMESDELTEDGQHVIRIRTV